MVIIPPIRKKKKNRPPVPIPPPTPQMLLTAASYDPMGPSVTLEFDHAIDLSWFDPAQIEVLDGLDNGARYAGSSFTQTGSGAVRVDLGLVNVYAGPANVLNATSSTGIVSPDDGATWAGVSDVVLPFS